MRKLKGKINAKMVGRRDNNEKKEDFLIGKMTNYLSACAKLMWDPFFSKDQTTSIFGTLSTGQLITTELSSSALDSNLPDLCSKTVNEK